MPPPEVSAYLDYVRLLETLHDANIMPANYIEELSRAILPDGSYDVENGRELVHQAVHMLLAKLEPPPEQPVPDKTNEEQVPSSPPPPISPMKPEIKRAALLEELRILAQKHGGCTAPVLEFFNDIFTCRGNPKLLNNLLVSAPISAGLKTVVIDALVRQGIVSQDAASRLLHRKPPRRKGGEKKE